MAVPTLGFGLSKYPCNGIAAFPALCQPDKVACAQFLSEKTRQRNAHAQQVREFQAPLTSKQWLARLGNPVFLGVFLGDLLRLILLRFHTVTVLLALLSCIMDQPVQNLEIGTPQVIWVQHLVFEEIHLVDLIDCVIGDLTQPIGQADCWPFADFREALTQRPADPLVSRGDRDRSAAQSCNPNDGVPRRCCVANEDHHGSSGNRLG
jgi:hypothetical protein